LAFVMRASDTNKRHPRGSAVTARNVAARATNEPNQAREGNAHWHGHSVPHIANLLGGDLAVIQKRPHHQAEREPPEVCALGLDALVRVEEAVCHQVPQIAATALYQ
jgi:hypothetical protein